MYCGNRIFVNWIQDKLKIFQGSNQKNSTEFDFKNPIFNLTISLTEEAHRGIPPRAVLFNSQLFQSWLM